MSTFTPVMATSAQKIHSAKTLAGALRLFISFPTPNILATKIMLFTALRCFFEPLTHLDFLVLVAVGIYWPFQEWFFHKTILHLKPRQIMGRRFDPMFAWRHRYHHCHPWVLETTFLPTGLIYSLIPIHVAAWFLLMPTWGLACTGVICFSGATLIYEWVHYLTHSNYRPKSTWLRRVYRNHAMHHFKNENYWFSFTVPWIDAAMRTAPEAGSTPQSETCRNLGVEDDQFDLPNA